MSQLMVDYNQALTVEEAIRRGRALDGEGVYWIEEPMRHDDYAGCAAIARALATPVQIGENFSLVHDMERALARRPATTSCPTSSASAASPAGGARPSSRASAACRCRRTCIRR